LTIPVLIENHIVAVIGVANKDSDYNNSDIRQLILLMDSVWKIVDRINLMSDLIRAKKKAEESDRLKTAFLQNMSHEIRTPMNGILGFTGLLKRPNLEGEKQKEYIDIIEKSGARMLSIINDIINISKIESGVIQINLNPVDLHEVFHYISLLFTPEASGKNIALVTEKIIPPILRTDQEKLIAILTNLVKNALKFTTDGSITTGCEISDQAVLFYVRDTGKGIEPEKQQIIFERFRQGSESDSRNYDGVGLGLAISKAYVEILDGKIWLESQPGKGSTFYFTLPLLG
jgi:signal transduction histidine kinase